jgi:PAS domain S-box-containing protein
MATDDELPSLRAENLELKRRLTEATETLQAIRSGEVDALLVKAGEGTRVYTLESAYEPYRLFVENMQEGAATVSADGIILYANPRFAEIIRTPHEQVLGSSIYRVLGASNRETLEGLLARDSTTAGSADLVVVPPGTKPVHLYLSLTGAPDGSRCIVLTDITDRLRLGEAVASRDWLRVTLASIGDGVISCDLEGRITFLNEVAAALTGWSQDDALGAPLADVFRIIDESTGKLAEDLVSRVLSERRAILMENHTTLVTLGDSQIAIEDSAAPIRDDAGNITGVVIVFHDVTEKRRFGRLIAESEARFRALFDHLPDAVMLSRPTGDILGANRAACEMFGMSEAELCARGRAGLQDVDDRRWESELQERQTAGAVVNVELSYVRANGEKFPGETSSIVVSNASGTYSFVIVRDISGRKRAEEALLEANAMLAESDRRKDEFIAILSHELRNPLAPIRYAVPLLKQQRLGERAGKALTVIERQTAHLTRLVDDLLDTSRIRQGKIELRREYVTVASVLTAGVEAASPAILAARHKLSIVAPDDPLWLHVDASRVAQVVTNLLQNSAKFTPQGGEIVLSARREGGRAVITVRDNGVGIPQQALPTVFDMFQQLDRSERPSQRGLGIGLALAKRLVEMHGGTIEASSAGPGQGTEFAVRLPIVQEGPLSAPETSAEVVVTGGRRRLRVLIVDDDADMVDMLTMAVEGAGHEVRKALDGGSALSTAREFHPDLMLLDLGLPVKSGIEVATELRHHPEFENTRLVALTGWGQIEDRRRCEEAGFNDHLTKPTDPAEIERILAAVATDLSLGK